MKKNHVRILSLLLAAMLALSACGGTNGSGKNDENQTTSNGGEPIKDFIDFQPWDPQWPRSGAPTTAV